MPDEPIVDEEPTEINEDDLIQNDEPLDVTDDDTPGDKVDDPDDPTPDPDKSQKPKKGGVQVKIDKLTKKAREAEIDAAYYRGLAEGKGLVDIHGNPVQDDPAPKPTTSIKRDDFDTEDEYVAALVDDQLAKKEADKDKVTTANTINAQYKVAREKYDDFDDVALSQTHPVNEHMFKAAMGEHLPDILYYLGQNHDVARNIAQMPPLQAAREIGKIEAAITNAAKPDPDPPKLKSKAPEPAPTVKGGGSSPAPANETRKERLARWEKEREERIRSGHTR